MKDEEPKVEAREYGYGMIVHKNDGKPPTKISWDEVVRRIVWAAKQNRGPEVVH